MLASTQIARKARERFALAKAIVLEDVADGKRTPSQAIATLEHQYKVEAIRFLRTRAHARNVWEAEGPLVELNEVLDAYAKGGAIWTSLLDRVRKAREERTHVG